MKIVEHRMSLKSYTTLRVTKEHKNYVGVVDVGWWIVCTSQLCRC